MKKSLAVLLAVEFVVAVVLGQVGHVKSSSLDRAWFAWYKHPTTETREAFEHEKRIVELERLGFSGVVFVMLAGATIFVCWARKGKPCG